MALSVLPPEGCFSNSQGDPSHKYPGNFPWRLSHLLLKKEKPYSRITININVLLVTNVTIIYLIGPNKNHRLKKCFNHSKMTFGVATFTSSILFPRKCSMDNAFCRQIPISESQQMHLIHRITKRIQKIYTLASSSVANVTYPKPRDLPVDRS